MMAAIGRPTKLDDLKAQRILDAIKGGSSRACAAGLVGVAVSTLYAWMAANPEFLERVRVADAHAEQRVVDALFALATDKTRPHFEAIKFWLKTWRAKTWRESQVGGSESPAQRCRLMVKVGSSVVALLQVFCTSRLMTVP
jgi:hypothetical protein